MTDQEKRIKLAEAMGWKQHPDGWWSTPRIQGCASHGLDNPPDPFTDANDCNALIKHLKGEKISVQVVHGLKTDSVRFWMDSKQVSNWKGDNWMHGVCELALKVLNK